MKLLVVGCGSVGKRHIGNFKSIGVNNITAADSRQDRLKEVQEKYGIENLYSDFNKAMERDYDAVAICTPPNSHTPIAVRAAEKNCHILIEKPISNSMEGMDKLLNIAKKKHLVIMVGYTYRFWPPLIKVKELLTEKVIGDIYSVRIEFSEYLPDWHPWEDYRTFYMAKKEQGGGAILDESHTVDFARWLFGEIKEVACFNDKLSNLEITSDDIAEMLVRFESGAMGNIHLDIFGRAYRKNLEIIGGKGNMYWDFYQNKVEIYHAKEKKWEIYPFNCDRNVMFVEEVKHFLDCAEKNRTPKISGEDGAKTLKCVLAAIESSKTKKMVRIT